MPDELFLIDGNSLAYRAFFALPESIATSTGFPTNAIFGFASMLVKLLTDNGVKPTVVVWDAGSSGRKELYEEYKGHRPRQPDLLGQQYPHMRPLVEAFGYTNYAVEGYEADDVIATLTRQAKAAGIPVTIVTGDRDAFQLVGDGVKVLATSRGITETKLYDELDLHTELARAPDRGRLREVFREFELRDPLRRLEEAFGEDAAAPAPPAEQTVSARLRQASLAEVAALDGELAVAVRECPPPEDQLFAETELRFGVATGTDGTDAGGACEVLVGPTVAPEDVVAACGTHPVVAHDAKALRDVPPNLAHDTLLAAYLLEPARRGYPFRELVEERGLAADVEAAAGG